MFLPSSKPIAVESGDSDIPKNDESIQNMKFHLSSIVAIMFAMISMEATADTPVGPYVLEGMEIHNIPSKILRRDCEVFVSLPDSCATGRNRDYAPTDIDAKKTRDGDQNGEKYAKATTIAAMRLRKSFPLPRNTSVSI